MARSAPSVNETWIFRAPITAYRERVTDETDETSVAYVLVHNNAEIETGTLEWEPEGLDNVWGKKITLPATPGILTMTVTATVGDNVGTGSTSLYVEKYS